MVRGRNKDSGWRLFVRTTLARAYPRIIGQQRSKSAVFIDVFLPTLSLSAYVFVCRAVGAPEALVGFVILGGAMTAFWLNVLWAMANQFFWEKETGNLALYIMAPASLMAVLLGMALGGMLSATVRAVLIIAIGAWLFGVHYAVTSVPLFLLVFLLVLTALYALGMTFASLFLLMAREGWHIVGLAQEPVYLVSGMYFPVKNLNFWVAAAASLIPLTLGLDALRQLAFADGPTFGFLSVTAEVKMLSVLAIALLFAARLSLSRMETLAIREGRLTESRG
jgi:ABC-2 type transport system permease protein